MIKSIDEEGVAVEMREEDIFSTKSQMGEVKEENAKLKQLISNVAKDYKFLETQFFQLLQHDEAKNLKNSEESNNSREESEEDSQLVSLTLGRNNSIDSSSAAVKEAIEERKNPESIPETWPPRKVLKTIRSSPDEQPLKKARVSVRTRCDAQTMNDGCQWRKYGQKVAKGNPCPRAYYRCTVSSNCPVRKQVQRCAEDMSILVTTYEGTHNHHLPPSATTMASTTSAAASMLKSHSSQSRLGSSLSAPLSNSSASISALNFSNRPHDQFYISKPSISSASLHPTITLDLTNDNHSHYSATKFSSSTRTYSPSFMTLNFSSGSPSDHCNFNTMSWNSSTYNHGTLLQHGMANNPRRQQHVYKDYNMKMANSCNTAHDQQNESLKESIAAATQMIASNPNFQSALAAAISSFVVCKGGVM